MGDESPFKPLSNYIIIEVVPRGDSKIVTPETVKVPLDKSDCIVVAISEEKEKDGTPMIRNIKVGDNVVLSINVMHTGQTLMIGKKEYVCVRETEVLGIFDKDYVPEPVVPKTSVIVN